MKALLKIIAALMTIVPALGNAHTLLEHSTPATNSTVKTSPEKVILEFEEPVELTALTLLRAGDSQAKPLGPLPKNPSARIEVALPQLSDGQYTISYSYAGADSHEMKGTIPFKVSQTAPAPATKGTSDSGQKSTGAKPAK